MKPFDPIPEEQPPLEPPRPRTNPRAIPPDQDPNLSALPLPGLSLVEELGGVVDDIRQLEARLGSAQPQSEVVVVPDVGHAFLNDTRPDAYRPVEAAQAWERSVAFLRRQLA